MLACPAVMVIWRLSCTWVGGKALRAQLPGSQAEWSWGACTSSRLAILNYLCVVEDVDAFAL
jgi:hypothetical protein